MTEKLALISVYDKTGLEPFALGLRELGFQILSTGGTALFLKNAGIEIQEVSDYTAFPEILGGRVKTLHPKIHAGILARETREDRKVLEGLGIGRIDLVAVNLYPFEEKPTLENIDIGGPTMLRGAAKNYERVIVVTDVSDYERVLEALKKGEVPYPLRKELGAKVFKRMVRYEEAIYAFFGESPLASLGGDAKPAFLPYPWEKFLPLRYGENPHQRASFFKRSDADLLWELIPKGKELSYNNIVDADAAWWLIGEFKEEPFASAIIKHTNPCGVATSENSLVESFERAYVCDATSAFGGIVALNREVDRATALAISKIFFEIILAPGFSGEARDIFSKKKNLRLLVTKDVAGPSQIIRSAGGGELVQEADRAKEDSYDWEVKSRREPTAREWRALSFAWKVVKHVKSNAVVFAHEEKIAGVGAGQTSRIDSVRVARLKSSGNLQRSVAASDAFFPFPDNIEELAKAGATAVIQPGGSIRDPEVIAAADHHDLAMVFTGLRHFRH